MINDNILEVKESKQEAMVAYVDFMTFLKQSKNFSYFSDYENKELTYDEIINNNEENNEIMSIFKSYYSNNINNKTRLKISLYKDGKQKTPKFNELFESKLVFEQISYFYNSIDKEEEIYVLPICLKIKKNENFINQKDIKNIDIYNNVVKNIKDEIELLTTQIFKSNNDIKEMKKSIFNFIDSAYLTNLDNFLVSKVPQLPKGEINEKRYKL